MLQNLNNLNFVGSHTVFFVSFFHDKVSVNCIRGRQERVQGLPGLVLVICLVAGHSESV